MTYYNLLKLTTTTMAESITFGGPSRKLDLVASGSKPITVTVTVGDLGCSIYGTVPRGTDEFVTSDRYLAMCRHLLVFKPTLNNGTLTHYTAFSAIRSMISPLGFGVMRNVDVVEKQCAIIEALERRGMLNEVKDAAAELPLQLDVTDTSTHVDPAIIDSLPPLIQNEVAAGLTPLELPAITMVQTAPLITPALGMENDDFNLSRYFFASGFIDQASRIGGTVNDEYVKGFMQALPRFNDDGSIRVDCDVLTCLCSRDEDLSVLTPLSVNTTAVSDMFELSHDHQPMAYLRTVYVEDYIASHLESLKNRETATPLVLKLSAVNSVTPKALIALVESKATDSIFNQADKRWMIGLDPMFSECWPGAIALLSMLFDHKVDYWSVRCRFILRSALIGMSDDDARPRVQMMRMHYSLTTPTTWYSTRGVYSAEGRSKIHYASGDRMRLGLRVGEVRDRQVTMLEDLSTIHSMDVANMKDQVIQKDVQLKALTEAMSQKDSLIDSLRADVGGLTERAVLVQAEHLTTIADMEVRRVQSEDKARIGIDAANRRAGEAIESTHLLTEEFSKCLSSDFLMVKPLSEHNQCPVPLLESVWPALCQRYIQNMQLVDEIWTNKLADATDTIATEMAEETMRIIAERDCQAMVMPVVEAPKPQRKPRIYEPSDDDLERTSVSSTSSEKKKRVIWSRSATRVPRTDVDFSAITAARRDEHFELGMPREGRYPVHGGIPGSVRATMTRGLAIDSMSEFPKIIDFGGSDDWDVGVNNVLRG
uniref:MuNS n=1 Tax=Piscine orthoreovirus TaxID=1157337 RepID=A0A7T0ME61_9REOV|nr:muNS [Piscine orthoreovirus]